MAKKTTYSVILRKVGGVRIAVVRAIWDNMKETNSGGLAEAYRLSYTPNAVVQSGLSSTAALSLQETLIRVGATADVQEDS